MRPSDLALSLSPQARTLLTELHAGSQVLFKLSGPVFELMQSGLAKSETMDKGYRVRLTAEGRVVAERVGK